MTKPPKRATEGTGFAHAYALEAIRVRRGLDYGAIGFVRRQTGDLLVFGANATMVISPSDTQPRWNDRRPSVGRALGGVRAMPERRHRRRDSLSVMSEHSRVFGLLINHI